MLRAIIDYDRRSVIAPEALREDAPFSCPHCSATVIFKCGEIRRAHFAHAPESTCSMREGESDEHYDAKLSIFKALRERGIECDVEVSISGGKRRADILASIGEQRVAIEIQFSNQSSEIAQERTQDYAAEGIAVLWIIGGRSVSDPRPGWLRWLDQSAPLCYLIGSALVSTTQTRHGSESYDTDVLDMVAIQSGIGLFWVDRAANEARLREIERLAIERERIEALHAAQREQEQRKREQRAQREQEQRQSMREYNEAWSAKRLYAEIWEAEWRDVHAVNSERAVYWTNEWAADRQARIEAIYAAQQARIEAKQAWDAETPTRQARILAAWHARHADPAAWQRSCAREIASWKRAHG